MKKSSVRGVVLGAGAALVCVALITAGTYSLFSDDVTINNHLQSGSLKATLVRTAHSYSILDEHGLLKEYKVESENVDSKDMLNAFDLPDNALIVPTSKLSATFQLQNNDTVAFDYSVSLVVNDENGEKISTFEDDVDYLASQLNVTLTGLTGTHTLADSGLTINGLETVEMGESTDFTLTVEFVDDNLVNNLMKNKNCYFDLIVLATQAI